MMGRNRPTYPLRGWQRALVWFGIVLSALGLVVFAGTAVIALIAIVVTQFGGEGFEGQGMAAVLMGGLAIMAWEFVSLSWHVLSEDRAALAAADAGIEADDDDR